MTPAKLSTPVGQCPTPDALSAFARGRLAYPALEAVAEHLAACCDCLRILAASDTGPDRLVAGLRGAAPPDRYADEPECQLLSARARQIDLAASDSTVPDASPEGAGCHAGADDGGPALLGPYRLLRRLGAGGMGVVYRAYDPDLHRTVAVKMLAADRFPGEAAVHLTQRFQQEAQVLAQLKHEHIVPVYEGKLHEGQPYFVMECVPGGNLARHLARFVAGRPRAAAAFLEKIARAVHYAHGRGVLHRDLKPANILLDADDRPLVSDFGLAKLLDDPAPDAPGPRTPADADAPTVELSNPGTLTFPGSQPGTPSYMAPEQCDPAFGRVGAATDVWALGVILYELLTGRRPFGPGDREAITAAVCKQEPPAPRSLRPGLDPALEAICLKCLRKEPARRYASAADLTRDLADYRADRPTKAYPLGRWGRLRLWARRHPYGAVVGGLAALILVAVAVAYPRYRSWAERRQRERDALAALDKGLTLLAEGESGPGMLWLARGLKTAPPDAADLQRVLRANLAGWSARIPALEARFPHPAAVLAAAVAPDRKSVLTGCADGVVRLWDVATGKELRQFRGHGKPVGTVAYSRDGRTLLTAGQDGTARLWDAATGKERWRFPGWSTAAALSPDGRYVVTARAGETVARLWDAATGKQVHAFRGHTGPVCAVAYAPDGRTVLTGAFDGSARLWDVKTGEERSTLAVHGGAVHCVAYRPDGKVFLTASHDQTARFWDGATGKVLGALEQVKPVRFVAFSPDSRVLLTGGDSKTFSLWDTRSRRPIGRSLPHLGWIHAAAFAPDARAVLTGSEDGEARLWRRPTEDVIHLSYPKPGHAYKTLLSPDGKTVLALRIEKTARLWDAATGRPLGIDLRHQDLIWDGAFSPDGKTVATASRDRTVCLWDVATGRLLHRLVGHQGPVMRVAFDPAGSAVLTASTDHSARLWDVRTGHPLARPLLHQGPVHAIAFSPDGRKVLTGSADHTAQLWDAHTGLPLGPPLPHDGMVDVVAFSPDGRTLLSAGRDHTARLWSAATGAPLGKPMRHQDDVRSACFSPDGTKVLTGSRDHTARLWQVPGGQPFGPPLWHGAAVESVAFSPDGHTALSGSRDRTARLWDVALGRPVGPPLVHEDGVYYAGFSRDGRTVLTSTQDGAAHLWKLRPALEGSPARVGLWARVFTGMELDATGAGQELSAQAWLRGREQLAQRGGAPGPGAEGGRKGLKREKTP